MEINELEELTAELTSQFPQLSQDDVLLGLHEAVTKLWIATKRNKKEK